MLPEINRLKKKKDIEKVFEEGQVFKEGFLIFKIAKNNSGKIRFGFIVSQKVSKRAVLRNKIKRRLRGLVGARLKKDGRRPRRFAYSCPGAGNKRFLGN